MFERYKKEQGKWTRGLTAGGGILVVALGAAWLWGPLALIGDAVGLPRIIVQSVGAALFLLLGSYLAFWISYVKPSTGDFFIATEGEMKKVSWSSRKEIIGSTQVVIVTLAVMGTLLFVVDIMFMLLFSAIGVLKIARPMEIIFGGGA